MQIYLDILYALTIRFSSSHKDTSSHVICNQRLIYYLIANLQHVNLDPRPGDNQLTAGETAIVSARY
jgi:hypothetical protein